MCNLQCQPALALLWQLSVGTAYVQTPEMPVGSVVQMVQVSNIMTTLDDAIQHITFTDGTMLNFVAQLNAIKDAIPRCMPTEHKQNAHATANYLRDACKCLNRAAVVYQRSGQNDTFYNKLYELGLQRLRAAFLRKSPSLPADFSLLEMRYPTLVRQCATTT